MAAAGTIFLENGENYLSTAWMDKIPVSPSDARIRDRLFDDVPEKPFLHPIMIQRNHQVYISLRRLNFLLTTSTVPLLATVFFEDDDEGGQKVDVSLTDMEGRQVLIDSPAEGSQEVSSSLERTKMQIDQSRGANNIREIGAPPTPSPGEYNEFQLRNNSVERKQIRAVQESQDGIGNDKQARTTIESAANAQRNNSITARTQDQTWDFVRDTIETTVTPSSPGWTLPSAALAELKGVQFSDTNTTLLHLLNGQFPQSLARFSEAADEFIHLATTKNGQTFWVKIFSSLDTYPHDFMCPTLSDPALKTRPISRYQSIELTRILKDISKTERGKPYRTWMDNVEEADWQNYRKQIDGQVMDFRKLLTRIKDYKNCKNLQGFLDDLGLLADNARVFHGKGHPQTAAAQLVVDDVYESMSQVSAIEKAEVQAFTGSFGLVREVVVASTKKRSEYTGPKYVLPLGIVHCSADRGAEKEEWPDVVLMDVMSPGRAIWVFRREPGRCVFTMLTPDIGLWKTDSADGVYDGGLMKTKGNQKVIRPRTWLIQGHEDTKCKLSNVLVYFKRAPKSLATTMQDSDSDAPLAHNAKRRKVDLGSAFSDAHR